jgi:hypothetical protein
MGGMPFDRTLRDWLKFNVVKEQTLMRVLPRLCNHGSK